MTTVAPHPTPLYVRVVKPIVDHDTSRIRAARGRLSVWVMQPQPVSRVRACFLGCIVVAGVMQATAQNGTDTVALPRVGPTIDAYERAYFGLFPDETRFKEARLKSIGANAFALVITYDPIMAGERSIAITGRERQLLSHYFLAYEDDISWPAYASLAGKGILRSHTMQPHPEEHVTVLRKATNALHARLLSLIDNTPCMTTRMDWNIASGPDTLIQCVPLQSVDVVLHTYSRASLGNAILGFLAGYAVGFILENPFEEHNHGSEFGVFHLSAEELFVAPLIPAAAGAAIAGTSMSTRTDTIRVVLSSDEGAEAIRRILSLCAFPLYPPPELLRSIPGSDDVAKRNIPVIRSYRETQGR